MNRVHRSSTFFSGAAGLILSFLILVSTPGHVQALLPKADEAGRKNLCQALNVRTKFSFEALQAPSQVSDESLRLLKESLSDPSHVWVSHKVPYWVELDLGQGVMIDKVILSSGLDTGQPEARLPEIKLLTATEYAQDSNAEVWKEPLLVGKSQYQPGKAVVFRFQSTKARWVRIIVDEPLEATAQINAFAIYEALSEKSEQQTLKPETAVFQPGSPYPYEPNFGQVALGPTDDGSTGPIPFGFALRLYGKTYTSFWINNNGNITLTGPLYEYTPFVFPNSQGHVVIAPFFGDADTRAPETGLVYVNKNTPGQVVVTWDRVGYYRMHGDKLNSFQLVVQDDSTFGFTDGDHVGFYWGDIQWTTGDLSNGVHASAGLDAGDGVHAQQVPGSFTLDILNWANTYAWYALSEGLPGDVTPPTVSITSGPAEAQHFDTTFIQFTWTATDNVTWADSILFTYRLDGAGFTEWGRDTSVSYTGLTEGLHLLEIKAKDKAGNIGSISRHFGIDFSPPNTVWISGPIDSGWATSSSVTSCWKGTDNLTQQGEFVFAYAMDGGPFGPWIPDVCHTFADLSDSLHTFVVKTRDKAGHEDPTPLEIHFTVDLQAPDTWVTQGPEEGSIVNSSSVTFRWAGDDDKTAAAALQFAYAIDGGNFSNWSSLGTVILTALSDGVHVFAVKSRDLAGNVDQTPATRSFRVDTKGPTITITCGPNENKHVADTIVTFCWSGTDAQTPAESLLFCYRLDSGEFGAWGRDTTVTLAKVPEGLHVFEVRGKNRAGNLGATVRHFGVDITPPNTQLVSGPSDGGWANNSTVIFKWTGTDNVSPVDSLWFSYRMDSASWSEFTREKTHTFQGLSDTTHVFMVKAKDLAGHEDETPLTIPFAMDFVPPETWITSGPADSSLVGHSSITLCWSGSDSKTETSALKYAYQVDVGNFSGFVSDTCHLFSGLSNGWHRVRVKAQDLAGNEDLTPAARTFLVDTTAPVPLITSGPKENEHLPTGEAGFEWNGSDNVTPPNLLLFAYSLDSTDTTEFSMVTSAIFHGLSEGIHSILLFAEDEAGNVGSIVLHFGVDFTAPKTQIVLGPSDGGWTNNTTVTFKWSGTDNLCPPESLYFSYRMDDVPWSSFERTTSHTFISLSVETHTFQVRAKDKAGHVDSTATSSTFSFDFGAPETQIVSGPAEGSVLRANSFAFVWSGSDSLTPSGSLLFSYKLDTAAFSAPYPETSHLFTYVGEGHHVFQIKAIDAATNEDPTPAVRTLFTDVTPPSIAFKGGPVSGEHLSVDSTTISWLGSDGVSPAESLLYAYRLDSETESKFDTVRAAILDGLVEGAHSFRVRAKDQIGNIGSSTLTFAVDFTAPNTFVTSGPVDGGWWPTSSVAFGWSGSDNLTPVGELLYSYKLDGDPFSGFAASKSHTFGGLSVGQHIFLVKAGDRAGREDETPAAVTFKVGFVDLVATSVNVPDNALYNERVSISWTVQNNGTGPAIGTWKDYVCMSADSLVGNDTLLRVHARTDSLAAGEHYTVADTVEFPYEPSGRVWVVVVTDGGGSIPEQDGEGNNALVSTHPVALSIPSHPDLVVQSIVPPADGWSGQGAYVEWTVLNQGGARADGPWVDRVYLSTDSLIGNDTPLGSPFYYNYDLNSAASYTHSHPVVFPQDIEGTYWIVVAADVQDSVEEYTQEGNNAAISRTPVTIHLTPFPDLQVDSVLVPPAVDAGSELALSWTVSNHGNAPTSAPVWYDKVYLSPDAILDGGDVLLGRFSNLTYLNIGTGYVQNKTVTLPTNISGTYYVIVKTDADGHVDEHNNEGNNFGVSRPFTVEFVPTSWCGLRVIYLTPISSVWSGQTVSLTWVVENIGTGPMGSTHFDDSFALSPDSVFHQSGWFSFWHWHDTDHVLAPGERDTLTASVTFPSTMSGNLYLFLIPDSHLNGGCGGIPFGRSITIRETPPPDLEIASVRVASDTSLAGAMLKVKWDVRNNGPGPSGKTSWHDWVYLSDNAVLDPTKDVKVGTKDHYGYLDVDSEYFDSLDVRLPFDLTGPQYVFVCADGGNEVPEGGYEGNNCARTLVPLQIILPSPSDLRITDMTSPKNASSGDTIDVSWTVGNVGEGATVVDSWTDALYLSVNDTLETGVDSLLGTFAHSGALAVDSEHVGRLSVGIPNGLEGSCRLIAKTCIEGNVYEGIWTSNNTLAESLHVHLTPPPDLRVTDLIVPSQGQSGKPLGIQWTVTNKGVGSTRAASWWDAVYLSADPSLDTKVDTHLADFEHAGALAAQEKYLENLDVVIPQGLSGSYYIIVGTDAANEVYEHLNEANNDRFALVVIQPEPRPDLDVISFEVLSVDSCGGYVNLRWTVKNTGESQANAPWTDAVYVSDDAAFEAGSDQVIETRSRTSSLGHNATYTVETPARFPDGTEGQHFLFLKTDSDNRITEANETNNVASVPAQVEIRPADLIVTNVDGPDSVNTGQPLTVQWTVQNSGTCVTGNSTWYDAVYLSRDRILDASDYDLGYVRHAGGLTPGASYEATLTGQLPSGISGTYYLFPLTDKNNDVYEHGGEQNNFGTDSRGVEVVIPASADLQVTSVVVDSTGVPGEEIQVRWTVINAGENTASGTWTDAVYVSADSVWDLGDPLVGTLVCSADLPPGSVSSMVLRLSATEIEQTLIKELPGVLPGDYHIVVRTDVRDNIVEQGEDNNIGVSGRLLRVDFKEISLGIPDSTIIHEKENKYLKLLAVPENVDLRISAAADSLDSAIELFVGVGRVPTRSEFDYACPGGYERIQTVTIPGTIGGSHYLLVHCEKAPSEGVMLRLLAETISFGISQVHPTTGGNQGHVTLTIEGAGFADSATVALIGPDSSAVAARHVSFLSSTKLEAQFDLLGRKPSVYSLVVSQGADPAVLRNAFLVKEEDVHDQNIYVTFDGPQVMRRGREASLMLHFTNMGNRDIDNTLVEMTTSTNVLFSPSLPAIGQQTGNTDNLAVLLNRLSPGESTSFALKVAAIASGSFEVSLRTWEFACEQSSSEFFPMPVNLVIKKKNPLACGVLDTDCDALHPPHGARVFQGFNLFNVGHEGTFVIMPDGGKYVLEQLAKPPGVTLTLWRDFLKRDGLYVGYIARVLSGEQGAKLQGYAGGVKRLKEDRMGVPGWEDYSLVEKNCSHFNYFLDTKILGTEILPSWVGGQAWLSPVYVWTILAGTPWIDPLGRFRFYVIPGEALSTLFYRWSLNAFGYASKLKGNVGQSGDPNEKVGPVDNQLSPFVFAQQVLPYSVHFENLPDATALAQQVVVTDVLDNGLDLRKFRLGEIAFGDTVVVVPENRSYWNTTITLDSGYLLEMDAGIDMSTREAHWIFNTIDPATGLPPLDPLAGFLPPNDSTHVGEGHVSFTIMPNSDVQLGTEIRNRATIVFDTNNPIETNEVVNVIRETLPDLAATSCAFTSGSLGCIEGEPFALSATIANQGERDAGGFSVSFFEGDPNFGGKLIGSAQLPGGLAVGAERQVQTTWTPKRMLGNRQIFIVTDREGSVAEMDETNNSRILTVFVEPRSYKLHLSDGTNMVSLPLEPQEPYDARSFAEQLGASMVVRVDTSGFFESYVLNDPEGPLFAVEGGLGYVASVSGGSAPTFQGMSHTGEVRVSQGLNVLSLPLSPETSLLAREWASRLGANTVIRYDNENRQFEGFIPDFHTGNGFAIEGGVGYVVTASRDTVVTFEGKGWYGEQALSSAPRVQDQLLAAQREASAVFGVTGTILTRVRDESQPLTSPARVALKDIRTGGQSLTRVNLRNGHFSGAFVDFTNSKPICVGDTICVTLERPDGSKLAELTQCMVTADDAKQGYIHLGNLTLDLPPAHTLAEQCFPNPFNPVTTIRYQIAEPGNVALRIFNVQGRLIKTLVDKELSPGYYQAVWLGDDDHGRKVASGVYFYRFTAPGTNSSHKMVLIK